MELPKPRFVPPLDESFRPAVLAQTTFERAAAAAGGQVLALAVERTEGHVSRFETVVLPPGHPDFADNLWFVERLAKFLLWQRGGWRLHVGGPPAIGAHLAAHYRPDGPRAFDADLMGRQVYGRPFEVVVSDLGAVPPASETTQALGRHLDGCRIGFDLGASDRKSSAVIDGAAVFSVEVPWDPRRFSNPQAHFDGINDSLKRAAEHLPRVDAIGGSAAGIYVDNQVRVGSLYRGVAPADFEARVKDLFLQLKAAWGGVPFEVVNDGEVTALAGSMSLGVNGILGVALGSSEAGGYVTPAGTITDWLNELAFCPVDYSPTAPVDEWSGDAGCGVQYFSQQAVGRLIPVAGLPIDPELALPEQLLAVQAAMAAGDRRAAAIYETLGIYLGYGLAHYATFYELQHVLVLGRVTSGPGGEILVERAQAVLAAEFPELAQRLAVGLPDEQSRRVGQAIAAASLPRIDGGP
jgi:predicted NBD/HSP70 family sugar kinase